MTLAAASLALRDQRSSEKREEEPEHGRTERVTARESVPGRLGEPNGIPWPC